MQATFEIGLASTQAFIPTTSPLDIKQLEDMINKSWATVSPTWPLKNLIAVNPLAGFEDLPFEEALKQGKAYFQQKDVPAPLQEVNRQTIKWLQAFFDEGQATIKMPMRKLGLLASVLQLLAFDRDSSSHDSQKKAWLKGLPKDPKKVIEECLLSLGISAEEQCQFFTLMLTTLPGWAAYIKYRTEWADAADAVNPHSISQKDYLAFRLVLTCLAWPEAKELLTWHEAALEQSDVQVDMLRISSKESAYREELLRGLAPVPAKGSVLPDAQLVFCIDVRSEQYRRALEAQGNYETFGFAGFFGVPVSIKNQITGESYASCPVLLKPGHEVIEHPACNADVAQANHARTSVFKKIYQSLKYTFATPFSLVEALGAVNGLGMAWRNFLPKSYNRFVKTVNPAVEMMPDLHGIPAGDQAAFAFGALRMMGLTTDFARLVVFCGHGSETQNNAYATALDCGACGGRHGAPNARILAGILNTPTIREELKVKGISIPEETYFLAAEHNTTTDELEIFEQGIPDGIGANLVSLKTDLRNAQMENSSIRARTMGHTAHGAKAIEHTAGRAKDWAQVRPEWGLARNAAFVVGPRALTKDLDLQGRSFLHSYDWRIDTDGSALTTILTAPMVVAQWINAQYLFSTLDNVAFGGGSKISKNITGKIGIMQGNASDLMHGLPMQSVYKTDTEAYHQPMRLMTVVYAPRPMIDAIVADQAVLTKLFGNGWVTLACIEPDTHQKFILGLDLKWQIQP